MRLVWYTKIKGVFKKGRFYWE